jgi:signal transduction histidine kinase
MPEEELWGDRSDIKQLSMALHDMCQPLTTLQCSLEMAALTDTQEAYREVMETGLTECRRLVAYVESMRAILQDAKREAENGGLEAGG